MSSNPVDRIARKPVAGLTPTKGAPGSAESAAPGSSVKPAIKPPLQRPFSLSLPDEHSAAQEIVKNIDASNKETERLTKKSADEEHLKQILEKQQAQDQVLNGPGRNRV
jgi:hypothetical protein